MSVLGRVGTAVRDSMSGTLRGTGQVTGVAIDVVRDTTVNALRGARTVGGEAGHLAQGRCHRCTTGYREDRSRSGVCGQRCRNRRD